MIRLQVRCDTRHYVIAKDASVAQDFFSTVCRASSEVEGQILVFSRGYWYKSEELLEDIALAKLENLILSDTVKRALTEDIEQFFDSEPLYRELGVPWKRGVLLLGPPGNGKTHAIKAMVNRLRKPCLYVRTFVAERGSVHGAIQTVFRKARLAAPCMLVLEDLDSLVDARNRSFFLNEMDGFSANEGVLTVATTNHPERLDPALLERPSRFDRKITFGLPEFKERRRFLHQLNKNRVEDVRLAEYELDELAERTEGFSFAYLKELGLSGFMAWMRERRPGGMGEAMLSQIEALRSQMQNEPPASPPEEEDEEDVCIA